MVTVEANHIDIPTQSPRVLAFLRDAWDNCLS
jgi:hypothetical protein